MSQSAAHVPKSPIKRVNMIILMQPNVEEAVAFYQRLGLPVIFHLKEKWAELLIGSVKLGLCPIGSQMSDIVTGIVLEVDDLDAFYAMYKDSMQFINEPKAAIHGHMVSLRDPGGNIIDLYQPTPEKVRDLIEKVKGDESGIKSGCCKETATDSGSKCAPKVADSCCKAEKAIRNFSCSDSVCES